MSKAAAPRVFISYSHDSAEHRDSVLAFADRLRADGIDAMIDQYVPFPPEGWPAWCEAQIRKAAFVPMCVPKPISGGSTARRSQARDTACCGKRD